MRWFIQLAASIALVGCESDSSGRPLGATCGEASDCESDLCIESVCIDPAECGRVFADEGTLWETCLGALRSIEVAPDGSVVTPGETVQFSAVGVFGEGTDVAASGTPGQPRSALAFNEVDLTPVVRWQSSGQVTFSGETPGLGTISPNANGDILVIALLGPADGGMSGRAVVKAGETRCDDGLDNDVDDLMDCDDPDCAGATGCPAP